MGISDPYVKDNKVLPGTAREFRFRSECYLLQIPVDEPFRELA